MNDYFKKKGYRTAEYVSKGHPDKICDQISDGILDEYLRDDSESRVAIEVMGGHGEVYISGEVTTRAKIDLEKIVQKVYSDIGYNDSLTIHKNIVTQSPDIALGVNIGGAGDQGIMVGYACNENADMVPQELYLARKLIKSIPEGFGPDAKAQVTINPDGSVESVVISAQHSPGASFEPLEKLAKTLSPERIYINPTGEFVIGGFAADTGLTGRKLAVDNYGPQIPIGGGCFSGKDATKVDRSAAYMARRIAVDYLKRAKANEVIVKLAYSIGVAEPVMAIVIINPDSFEQKNDSVWGKYQMINLLETSEYDLTPEGIIKFLDLKNPIFLEKARNGHFHKDY